MSNKGSELSQLQERFAADLAPLQHANECLDSIRAADSSLNAVAQLESSASLESSWSRATSSASPLHGAPTLIKSNLCWDGRITHCGSRMLEAWRAPYTATAIARLLEAGCLPLGHTHMDEFAMGSSGENSAFGACRNPWDSKRVPGGSSSGSAAAVAAGYVPFALGSDTGGSVRQPAAFCGISGFKPTYGRISRFGLVAFASSMDQVGIFARSAEDIEQVLAKISGRDSRDPSCLDLEPYHIHGDAPDQLTDLRIGVLSPTGCEADVRASFEQSCAELRGLGARLEPIELPMQSLALAIYYVLASAEASSNLARFDGIRFGGNRNVQRDAMDGTLQELLCNTRQTGLGAEVQRRILLGTHALSHGYAEAWHNRARLARAAHSQALRDTFRQVDLLVSPTAPEVAFEIGARTANPVSMYSSDALTVPASLAGLPAISIPGPLSTANPPGQSQQLPVGLQIIGPALADRAVLRTARAYQRHTGHHLHRPPNQLKGPRNQHSNHQQQPATNSKERESRA